MKAVIIAMFLAVLFVVGCSSEQTASEKSAAEEPYDDIQPPQLEQNEEANPELPQLQASEE